MRRSMMVDILMKPIKWVKERVSIYLMYFSDIIAMDP
jgi:hypothetical protein